MKAKIYLNQPLTQDRYGLHFDKGEALCENEYIIQKLIKKGVKVEIIEENLQKGIKEKTIDEMTIAELKKYAAENDIEIPSNAKNKADIIEFIINYKKDEEETKNLQINNEEDVDTKDGTDENLNTNLNNVDGEDNNEEDDGEEQKAE